MIGLVIVILLAFGGYYFYMYQELLGEQQQAHLYNQLLINGQVLEKNHLILDDHGRYLISVEAVQGAIDQSVYLSGSKSRIYIPMLGKSYRLETSKLTQYVQQHIETINLPIIRIEDRSYVELSPIEKLYGLTVETIEDYHTTIIENRSLAVATGINKVKLTAMTDDGMKSIGKFSTKQLVLLKEEGPYAFVLTDNGEIGYVEKKTLTVDQTKNYFVDQALNKPRINNHMPKDFTLSWHQVGTFAQTSDIGPQKPLPIDVISPTWFALNVEGIVINEASADYVKKAHEKGYKVWGLYSNSFKPAWTKELFESPDYTSQSIAQILLYSALYNIDGINFDFENMYMENRPDYVSYIEQSVEQLQYQNLRTSLDVTVPWGSDQWSKVYDRVALSKLVDYMCLMAYDEFWASSKKAGPVASMAWVEKGITESLKLIPREKLVLSLPLYMRTWAIQSNGHANSKSMGWKTASGIKENFKDQIVYDEKSGQNFVAYKKEGTNYKLWLEDAYSMKKRLDMVKKYDLPGVALWSKVFATDETWGIIENLR